MSSDKPNQHFISWKEVEAEVANLCTYMEMHAQVPKPKRIIGIARGGLPIATMLAHRLEVTDVQSVNVQFRDGTISGPGGVVKLTGASLNQGPDTWVVDELWDSGKTMKYLKTVWASARLLTLYHKVPLYQLSEAPQVLDYAGNRVDPNSWLVFPWERMPPQNDQKV